MKLIKNDSKDLCIVTKDCYFKEYPKVKRRREQVRKLLPYSIPF